MSTRSTPVIVHLTGDLRGRIQPLAGSPVRIGSSEQAEIRLGDDRTEAVAAEHAVLSASRDGYRLRVVAPHRVWVNGRAVTEHALASGDLLEVGEGGPLLRFRLQPAGHRGFKSVGEAVADSYQSARAGGESVWRRALLFAGRVVGEIASQVSPATRMVLTSVLVVLAFALVLLTLRTLELGRELRREVRQVQGLRALLESTEADSWTARELERLRRDLERRLDSAAGRLDVLEERATATERTIAEATRSVIFLQGAYGFRDARSGRDLRFEVGADGRPLSAEGGEPRVTTAGDGPIVEARYTGTGFVASPDGLILTNRHVALPWEFDDAALEVISQGYQPVMWRLLGYLPGTASPVDLLFTVASDEADLAVLRSRSNDGGFDSLTLASRPAEVGQPIVVLGFPTGIQAMLARADRRFLDRLSGQRLDFWQIARRLSEAGQIAPLATRGIIGQATGSSVVYDAETASGGSGGPVLGLDGRVVAVNSAVLRQFGGSNLGVPVARAALLLKRAAVTAVTTDESP